jgi:O-antigen/teichoic acid export membrane protein
MSSNASPPPSVGSRVARGAGWIFGFKLLERSLGFISTLILARLLVPADFGIIAMATSLMAILEMLTAFNFETALIQKPSPTTDDYNTAWTLNTLFGIVSAVAMVGLALPLASFYREPDLVAVVLVLAVAPLVSGVYNVGLVEYRKNLQFRPDFMLQASKKIGGFVVTVPLALLMRSYWALVIGMVAGRAIGTVVSYALHSFRPRPSLKNTRSLLNFSVWVLIGNGLITARMRASHFVLGRIGGAEQLGVFAMSSDVTTAPTTELVMPINRAIYPAYAQMASSPASMRRAYIAVIQMIAFAVAPTTLGLIAVAPLAIPLLLGPAWSGVIPLVAPLAIFGLCMSLQTNSMPAYLAMGQPKLAALTSGLALLLLLVPVVPLTAALGSKGTALACMISGALTVPFTFWLMARLLGLTAFDFLLSLWRPAAASLLMLLAVELYLAPAASVAHPSSPWLLLLSAVAIGAVAYVLSALLLWRLAGSPEGAEAFVLSRVRKIRR